MFYDIINAVPTWLWWTLGGIFGAIALVALGFFIWGITLALGAPGGPVIGGDYDGD